MSVSFPLPPASESFPAPPSRTTGPSVKADAFRMLSLAPPVSVVPERRERRIQPRGARGRVESPDSALDFELGIVTRFPSDLSYES